MRRKAFFIIIILFLATSLFAERIWVFSDNTKNITSFDLEKTLYLPKFSTTYSSSKTNYGNSSSGTYGPVNVIGNFGCIDCGCEIEFTVTTTGRFVSQSDSSKYRDFQLAVVPRITDQTGDMTYLWDESTTPHSLRNSEARVPHTDKSLAGEEKELIIKAPGFNGSHRKIDKYALGDEGSTCTRWWCDLLMIMDDLTAEDYRHMSENNDYVARVKIDWKCDDDSHANHKGSFSLVLRGYFGVPEGGKEAKVFVIPDPKAINLNILDTMGGSERIAQILVLTNTSSTDWSNRIFMFLSSDPDAWSNSNGTFKLKQVKGTKTIPFTVTVKYESDNPVTYLGDDTYSTASFLNLHTKSGSINRDGKRVYLVDYTADVFINIPISDNSNPDIAKLANGDDDTIANYAGVYSTYIYYHVIYDDGQSQ